MELLTRKVFTRRSAMTLGAVIISGLYAAPSFAEAEINAGKFIRTLGDELLAMLSKDTLTQKDREAEFRRLFTANVDVEFIARLVIGRYWRNSSEKDRSEYLQLFEDFFVKSYALRLSTYSGETFTVKDTRTVDDRDSVVTSIIERGGAGTPLHVDWRLRRSGSELRIIDVTIEGISMVLTQREEFGAVVQKNGGNIGPLNDLLRQRIAALG